MCWKLKVLKKWNQSAAKLINFTHDLILCITSLSDLGLNSIVSILWSSFFHFRIQTDHVFLWSPPPHSFSPTSLHLCYPIGESDEYSFNSSGFVLQQQRGHAMMKSREMVSLFKWERTKWKPEIAGWRWADTKLYTEDKKNTIYLEPERLIYWVTHRWMKRKNLEELFFFFFFRLQWTMWALIFVQQHSGTWNQVWSLSSSGVHGWVVAAPEHKVRLNAFLCFIMDEPYSAATIVNNNIWAVQSHSGTNQTLCPHWID